MCVYVSGFVAFLKCLLLVVSPSKNQIPADLQELNAIFFSLLPCLCALTITPRQRVFSGVGGGGHVST